MFLKSNQLKQPTALLQPAVSYLIPLSLMRGVRGEVN